MRKLLDRIYVASAALSATSMAIIAVIVVIQVSFRVINSIYFSISHENLALIFPSSAEFVGFLMVATSFLGLTYTLRKDGHIRVSILLNSISKKTHRIFEFICLSLGTIFTLFILYHAVFFVIDSYVYDELSYGIIAIPLFIPQIFMLLGVFILSIAFLDDLISFIMGRQISYSLVEETEIGSGGVE